MSTVNVYLEKIKVTEGQGAAEGKLELRVQVSGAGGSTVWPSASGTVKVDVGETETIHQLISSLEISSATTKDFSIAVTEVDKGTLGADDSGDGSISFDLSPDMSDTTKSDTISLHREHMSDKGKVKVYLKATS